MRRTSFLAGGGDTRLRRPRPRAGARRRRGPPRRQGGEEAHDQARPDPEPEHGVDDDGVPRQRPGDARPGQGGRQDQIPGRQDRRPVHRNEDRAGEIASVGHARAGHERCRRHGARSPRWDPVPHLISVNSNGAPYGSLRFMKLFRSTGSRSRTRRSSFGIGLVAAVLFAVVPAVQAYCGIELPAGTQATYGASGDRRRRAPHSLLRCLPRGGDRRSGVSGGWCSARRESPRRRARPRARHDWGGLRRLAAPHLVQPPAAGADVPASPAAPPLTRS